jgi:hypothetical protein
MSFQLFKGGRGCKTVGLVIRMNSTGATMSKTLREALKTGYDVAVDLSSGQVAILIGGQRKPHSSTHKILGKAFESVGAKEGQQFNSATGAEPLPIRLGDGGTVAAYVFNVKPAKGGGA